MAQEVYLSMLPIVHIANAHIEFEFADTSFQSLEQSLSRHPTCLQLQFLPLLYANPEDVVAITSMPDQEFLEALQKQKNWWPEGLPTLALLNDISSFQGGKCLSWGASRQVQAWAQTCGLKYDIPDWQVVKSINSKAFSFRYTSLPEAVLVSNEQELSDWLRRISGAKVFKTCFGLAGQGNFLIEGDVPSSELLAICRKEWGQKRPVVAEPWLDRLCDFSTQWFIHPNQTIELIGATRFESDASGTYQGTLAGPQQLLFHSIESFLHEHCQYAQKPLLEIAKLGFYGSLGIDAFLYRHPHTQATCLNPLVEINARQTMSLAALRLQRRVCPNQILRLVFQPMLSSSLSLLPSELINPKGRLVKFRRGLSVEILPL